MTGWFRREKRTLKAISMAIFACALLVIPSDANAASARSLNDKNVTNFIKKTTRVMNGTSKERDIKKLTKYLKKHVHKNARFRSTLHYHVPDYPTQETAMSIDKDALLANINENKNSVDRYKNEIEILNVKIAKNGRDAIVETKSSEEGFMDISPDGIEVQTVPIDGSSTCSQVIRLSKANVMQMHSAQCVTDIYFEQNAAPF